MKVSFIQNLILQYPLSVFSDNDNRAKVAHLQRSLFTWKLRGLRLRKGGAVQACSYHSHSILFPLILRVSFKLKHK